MGGSDTSRGFKHLNWSKLETYEYSGRPENVKTSFECLWTYWKIKIPTSKLINTVTSTSTDIYITTSVNYFQCGQHISRSYYSYVFNASFSEISLKICITIKAKYKHLIDSGLCLLSTLYQWKSNIFFHNRPKNDNPF